MNKNYKTNLFPTGTKCKKTNNDVCFLPTDKPETQSLTKLKAFTQKYLLLAILLTAFINIYAQSSQTKYSVSVNTTTTQTTATVPINCYYVLIECIGGGGGGGGSSSNGSLCFEKYYGGSGGGGGAYSAALVAVTPNSTLYIQTGGGGSSGNDANGGNGSDSYVKTGSQSGTALCLAKGGAGGGRRQGTRGAGGSASDGVGDIKYSGGGGALGGGNGNAGGGGGNAAGLGGAGQDNAVHQYPTHQTSGAYTHPPGPGNPHGGKGWGGAGGDGGGAYDGSDGNLYGGGGGGAFTNALSCISKKGGVGAQGIVIITYYTSTTKPSLPSPAITGSTNTLCAGGQLQLTVNLPTIAGNGTKTSVGTDTVYSFTGNGWFTSPGNIDSKATMLVVGGGGGGGKNGGGGGGAGEYVALSNQTINAGVYQVGVGAGGAAATANTVTASNGHISIFGTTIKANGGGGGASRDGGGYPLDGGSGGAGSGAIGGDWRELYGAVSVKLNSGAGNAGANGYGNAGCYSAGGGGGGSTGGGGGSGYNKGGNGAGGTANSITGTSIKYAAGGGGGVTCANSGYTNGLAGDNTGGAPGGNPTANSGSGGGGGFGNVNLAATAGAAGVVIIRLPAGAWSSSNTNVATVNATSGLVTAVANGTATISYTIGGNTYGTYNITVATDFSNGTGLTANQTICYNTQPATISYSAAPGGTAQTGQTITYQWYKQTGAITAPTGNFNGTGWTVVSGATSATLTGATVGNLTATTTFALEVISKVNNGGVYTTCYDNWAGNAHVVYVSGEATAISGDVLATANSTRTCTVNDNNWHYFRNNTGQVIAAINSNNEDLGNVTLAVTVNGTPNTHGTGGTGHAAMCNGTSELSLRRYYTVTTDNTPVSGVTSIRLFFTSTGGSDDYSNYSSAIATNVGLGYPYTQCYGTTSVSTDLAISRNKIKDITLKPANNSPITALAPSGTTVYEFDVAPANLRLTANSSTNITTAGPTEYYWHTNGGIGEPLPLELVSFTGYNEGPVNKLQWITASELNTDRFEVEKSISSGVWTTIGTVAAAGNSNKHITYNFEDNMPVIGDNYYRLKMIDLDGTFKYSNTINIPISEAITNGFVGVYPNPTGGELNVDIQSVGLYDTYVSVYDVLGKTIFEKPVTIVRGMNKLQFNFNQLAKGTYILRFADAQGTLHSAKFVKD